MTTPAAPEDGRWHQPQDWRPIPDPTALTDAAIARTTVEFRRELDALRAVLTERITAGIASREATILALRETIETRLNAMDHATELLDQGLNRTPTAIQTVITNLRDVYDERFRSVQQQLMDRGGTYDQRFASIAQQFSERDVRTDQAATASASALAAALQAAKEAVFEQAQAAAKAAEKTELSFTKQIDQIQLQIKTIGDGFSDRIAELKERIDRGEGTTSGSAAQAVEQRAVTGLAQNTLTDRATQTRATISIGIAALSAIVALIVAIILITKGG